MAKDRVKHIRSRPHHPMTLGKIEGFWQSILGEFLKRAQFTSYEDGAGRIDFWVKYYNYKLPHQGIVGLCPADRFFEIDTALKKTLEKGVEENALELARLAENAAHALNHKARRCLFGKNACRAYFGASAVCYDKRKRKEVHDWITDLAVDLSARCGKNKIDPAAWRIAARKWGAWSQSLESNLEL